MRSPLRLLLVAAVMAVTLGPAAAATAAPAKSPPGNSAAAKACQKGGWKDLATAESPTVPFTGQSTCVSYAARGGTIVPLESTPSTRLVVTVGAFDGTYCSVTMTLVNPEEGVWYYADVPVYPESGGSIGSFRPLFPPGSPVATWFKLEQGSYMDGAQAGSYDLQNNSEIEPIAVEIPVTTCDV